MKRFFSVLLSVLTLSCSFPALSLVKDDQEEATEVVRDLVFPVAIGVCAGLATKFVTESIARSLKVADKGLAWWSILALDFCIANYIGHAVGESAVGTPARSRIWSSLSQVVTLLCLYLP